MRFQKLAMISILAAWTFQGAFSQTNSPGRKSSEEFFRENSAAPSRGGQRSARKSDSADDALWEILGKKQMELDAREQGASAAQSKQTKQKSGAAETSTTVAQPKMNASVPNVGAPADDRLLEILRNKQTELDDQRNTRQPLRSPRPKTSAIESKTAGVPSVTAAPGSSVEREGDAQLEEILRRKQMELDAKGNAASSVTTTRPSELRMKETRPAPMAPNISQPASIAPAASTDEDRLSEILRRKQAELNATETAARPMTRTPGAKPMKEVTEKEREESEKRIKKIEAEIKAKEDAMQKRMATQSKSTATSASATENVSRKNSYSTEPSSTKSVSRSSSKSKVQPLPLPEVDLSTKEGRLAELLRKYKADEITPHEYHLERAKIIGEP